MGASVFVAKRGGMIITCAATSGFKIEYDNRYLWMNLKTLKGCHFANYREAWEANRLVVRGHASTRRCRRCTRSTRPARPRTRCTTTSSRARSACCASRPKKASASPTTNCAREHIDQITLFRRHAVNCARTRRSRRREVAEAAERDDDGADDPRRAGRDVFGDGRQRERGDAAARSCRPSRRVRAPWRVRCRARGGARVRRASGPTAPTNR